MGLTRVGTAAVESSSITFPGSFQNGDAVFMLALNIGSITTPTIPAGWSGSSSSTFGTNAMTWGWRLIKSSSDTSGSWTSATAMICAIYRNVSTIRSPLGSNKFNTSAGSATMNWDNGFAAFSLAEPGTSWMIGLGGCVSTTSNIATAPTSMTNQTSLVGATAQYVVHDTNGPYASNGQWPLTNINLGVSVPYADIIWEVCAQQDKMNNYQFVKVGDGMSVSEKIR